MKTFLFLFILLIATFPANAQQWDNFIIYWDAAKTDTQAAVIRTDSLVSQSFKVWPDMTMQVYIQAGDTAATLDSTKVRIYAQFSFEDVAARYRYTWCDVDSIGLDSTQWDKSTGGGSDWQNGIDVSTNCPARWARLIAKGLATNSISDSTKFSVHIERYVND